ncbi:hypothetical protein MKX03_036252 [Papaver bracteatum]|nr:hypothetical protein MKX03_036252 [Papaver bracteatum]
MRLLSFITSLFLFSVLLQVNENIRVQGKCLKDQRTLLRSSWSSSADCCSSWEGVTCDRNGRVIGLDLSNESIEDGVNSSSILFKFQYLQKLNLAFNGFTTPLPSGFDMLNSLTHLNLSNSGFNGQIPIAFSRMTRLVTLDLSSTQTFSGPSPVLIDPNLEILTRNLTSLKQLLLDGIYISDKENKWSRTLSSSLPKLEVLSLSQCSLSGPFDPSFSRLQSLSKLQLSWNNFSTEIPDFFGAFPNLTFLDLSHCELHGEFPQRILNSRTLQNLYLEDNVHLEGSLPEFRKDGVLQELVLSGTSFTGELPYSIGNLRFLSTLRLFNSRFSGSIPASISNLHNLQTLELAWNNFTGLIPPISCKNLLYLSLSQNGFTGPVPFFNGSESLEYIGISNNRLTGPIHSEWSKLQKLGTLQLGNNSLNGTIPSILNNQFQGPIPVSISKLSKLSTLNLRSNNFSGTTLDLLFGKLRNLQELDLSGNTFSINTTNTNFALYPQFQYLKLSSCNLREIPIFLKNQSNLQDLDLSSNQIRGKIPNWISKIGDGNLSNNFLEDLDRPLPVNSFQYVENLDMHSNMLQGKNPILPSLGVSFLDYSFNNFTMLPNISSYLSSASFLSFSSNQINGEIPASLCDAIELQILDLSYNNLSGKIPSCLGSLPSLVVLNLRGNNLSGRIPNICRESLYEETWHLTTLNLNGNKLQGKLLSSISNCTMLEFLDVGNNHLNGGFPSWLGSIPELRVLVLRSNRFYGSLGNECNFPMLQIIDISSNGFSGVLSKECLSGWKAMMAYETKAEWNRKDHILGIEYLMGKKLNYQVEITNKGIEVKLVKIVTAFTSIDFSNNKFEGAIPIAIGNFTPLYNFNFSRNSLTGSIPSTFGNLKHLESLDLSQNKLTGEIPFQLASLSTLSVLNLSSNQLEGRIPLGNQFQTFLPSSFEGNDKLCGSPLPKYCKILSESPQNSLNYEDDQFDWVLVTLTTLGFLMGASIVIGPQYFWKKGRERINKCMNKILCIGCRLLLLFFIFSFSNSDNNFVQGKCLSDQKALLLQLNHSLSSDYFFLSSKRISWSWNTDCCSWGGIICDEAGHVISLDLSSEGINGGLDNSSSLLKLQYLERLNLAHNFLDQELSSADYYFFARISASFLSELDQLTNLKYLNLSNSGLTEQFPISISRLTRLATLDLSSNNNINCNDNFCTSWPQILSDPNLETLVHNLAVLRELVLDGIQIFDSKWCQTLSSSLPKLEVLSLADCSLSGPLDSSLLKLESLNKLNLSYNSFSSEIPNFLGGFPNLISLDLSYCDLYGKVPQRLLHIRTLQGLYLSNNERLHGSLPEFPMDGKLRTLVLSDTSLTGELPNSIGNLKLLSCIDLRNSKFHGSIPVSFSKLNQLQYLDLSSNSFTGLIPSFDMSESLIKVDLSNNRLAGPILSHRNMLPKLVSLNLKNNSFKGTIQSKYFTLPSLQKLDLSMNHFTGHLGEFSNVSSSPLEWLDLSDNKLQGPIPVSIFQLSELLVLRLDSNEFSGTVSLNMVFHKMRNLSSLSLSGNKLSIRSTGANFALFPQLDNLRFSSCNLTEFPVFLKNQSRMNLLDLSNNNIHGKIPNWIWKIGNGYLYHLNLSHNFLEDPDQLLPINSFQSLNLLDFHSNMLQGKNIIFPSNVKFLDYSLNNFTSIVANLSFSRSSIISFFSLASNQLSGVIPMSICEVGILLFLDLSYNNLSGPIPPCILRFTEVLLLRGNNFQGNIPETLFVDYCNLKTLDLNGNRFNGHLPRSLANCTMLEVLDFGNNQYTGGFPSWLGNMSHLRVLVLRSNKFYGPWGNQGTKCNLPKLQIIDLSSNKFSGFISNECFSSWKAMMVTKRIHEDDILGVQLNDTRDYQQTVTVTSKGINMKVVKIRTSFTSIDFSNNLFEGEIPEAIGNLTSLYILNFSRNALTGPIPSTFGNLTHLESLDLSHNMLTGEIPSQIAGLSFLSVLNFSFNKLAGKIPSGNQFQTFTADSFIGNDGLCGAPLSKECSYISKLPQNGSSSNDDFDWVLLVVTFLGFLVGASIVIGPQYFCKRGREWANELMNKMLRIE